jgi:hypothetical protein
MNRNIKNPKLATLPVVRCAIYTRKSTEEGLEQEFNSLDAQRESGEAVRGAARRAGGLNGAWRSATTTAASPAATWSGRP